MGSLDKEWSRLFGKLVHIFSVAQKCNFSLFNRFTKETVKTESQVRDWKPRVCQFGWLCVLDIMVCFSTQIRIFLETITLRDCKSWNYLHKCAKIKFFYIKMIPTVKNAIFDETEIGRFEVQYFTCGGSHAILTIDTRARDNHSGSDSMSRDNSDIAVTPLEKLIHSKWVTV